MDIQVEHLQERVRVFGQSGWNPQGRYVLYWMHNALRAHENPALDVALCLARMLDLSIFVYQGLSERHRFASDRHHAFILQGARDAHAELRERGIGSVLHVERPGHRGPHLRTLTQQAAILVTEDLPVEPVRSWVQRLSKVTTTPLWLVDTACIAPMRLVGRAYDRAFAYRDATRDLYDKRLTLLWPEQPNPGEVYLPDDLPFEPVDPEAMDIPLLLGECDIDHTIGPIPHTAGGSRAGYARWEEFKQQRLRHYARDRNDALRDGVSRMSAYLHYGMVSPFRLAREAAAIPGPGSEKYLDELLIWRELAYAFCLYRPDHEELSALPRWAVATLAEHEQDTRSALFDWETLARARTGDPLWDAAQMSLMRQGELHNNVRMTWGKAFLPWAPDACTALSLMIDLNHRYALDGRSPASYGGLLWCMGQFDRPHTPGQAITGTVRSRPIAEHMARLNPEQYLAVTTRPWHAAMPSVAVIGSGLSGLIAARTLADHGIPVTVFDKGRGPGGRAATREVDADLAFDHGAQYFTVHDAIFRRHVQAWEQQGHVGEWTGRIIKLRQGREESTSPHTRYVGIPGMKSVGQHLARDLTLKRETRIASCTRTGSTWALTGDHGESLGSFDYLISTVPSPQVSELLLDHPFAERAARIPMTPCWAVMVAFEERLPVDWDGAFVHDSPLGWVARNSSKPGRPAGRDCWVLHATAAWSAEHLEEPKEVVLEALLKAFATNTGVPLPKAVHTDAHRWRYSLGLTNPGQGYWLDRQQGCVVAGDWLAGGRIEGAFLAGSAAAGAVLREIGIPGAYKA